MAYGNSLLPSRFMVDARMASGGLPLAETNMRSFIAQQGYFDHLDDQEGRKTGGNWPAIVIFTGVLVISHITLDEHVNQSMKSALPLLS